MMTAHANSKKVEIIEITEIIEIIEITEIAKGISIIGELNINKNEGCEINIHLLFLSSGNDFRGNMTRGGNADRRDDRRDNNRRDAPRRDSNEIRRDEPRRERNVKDFEERMPKYQAPAGPVIILKTLVNLTIKYIFSLLRIYKFSTLLRD